MKGFLPGLSFCHCLLPICSLQQPLRDGSRVFTSEWNKLSLREQEGPLSPKGSSAINFTFHWNTWWRKNLILLLPCLKPSKSLPMARGCTSQRWLHTRNTWEISEMPVSWLQPRPIMPESMGGGIQALHWCFVFWKLLSDSQRRSRRSTDALTDLCQAP